MQNSLEKIDMRKICKKALIVGLVSSSLLLGGVVAHANRTTNENSQIRVYLNYSRPLLIGSPHARGSVRTLTNQSRRIRVGLRWYNDLDRFQSDTGWSPRNNTHAQGQRLPFVPITKVQD